MAGVYWAHAAVASSWRGRAPQRRHPKCCTRSGGAMISGFRAAKHGAERSRSGARHRGVDRLPTASSSRADAIRAPANARRARPRVDRHTSLLNADVLITRALQES